jgi:hypothetical protein
VSSEFVKGTVVRKLRALLGMIIKFQRYAAVAIVTTVISSKARKPTINDIICGRRSTDHSDSCGVL